MVLYFWRGWCREDHLFFLSSLRKTMTLNIIYLDETFNLFKSSYITPSLFNQAHLFAPTEQSDGWGEWDNALSFVPSLSLAFVLTSSIPFALILKRREIVAITNYRVRYQRWVGGVGRLLVACWNSFLKALTLKTTCIIKWTCHIMLNVSNLVFIFLLQLFSNLKKKILLR